jgi:hypothetical protein
MEIDASPLLPCAPSSGCSTRTSGPRSRRPGSPGRGAAMRDARGVATATTHLIATSPTASGM